MLVLLLALPALCAAGSFQSESYSADWTFDDPSMPDPQAYFTIAYANIPDNFWTGIGFGRRMSDSDAVIITVQNGQVDVIDAWIAGYSAYGITLEGPDSGVTVENAQVVNGQLLVQFSRPLAAFDTNDIDIGPSSSFYFIPSGGDFNGQIQRHRRDPVVRQLVNGEIGGSNGGRGGGGGGGGHGGDSSSDSDDSSDSHGDDGADSSEEQGGNGGNGGNTGAQQRQQRQSWAQRMLSSCGLSSSQVRVMGNKAATNSNIADFRRQYCDRCGC